MKNMTKVLVSVALSGSLFFSTLGDSASAKVILMQLKKRNFNLH